MTSCPASYYLCPSSFNYGCCQSGLGCAANACYVTTPSTYTITETVTTTNVDAEITTNTLTATTVLTPTPPTALPTSSDPNAVAKFIPTKVDKVLASSAPSGNGGGLTRAQLGGIIAGAVAMLIIFITLTVIIIRRLNRVAEAIDSRKESSAGDLSRTHPPGMTQYGRPPPSDAGDEQVAFAGTNRMRGGGGRARSDSGYSTSQQPTPHNFPSSTLSDSGNSAGYFDSIPSRVHNLPGHHPPDNSRASTDSQAVSSAQPQQQQRYGAHGRHWSSASEQSANSSGDAGAGAGVGSPLLPAELDTDGAFIPELPTTTGVADGRGGSAGNSGGGGGGGGSGVPGVSRPWLVHARRHSGGHARGRSEGSVSGASGGGGGNGVALDVVSESVEVMHGYYGPRN